MAVMLKWYSFQFLFLIRIGFQSVYKNVLKKTKNLKKEKYYYQIISLGFKYFPEFWMKGFFLFKGYFPIQKVFISEYQLLVGKGTNGVQ